MVNYFKHLRRNSSRAGLDTRLLLSKVGPWAKLNGEGRRWLTLNTPSQQGPRSNWKSHAKDSPSCPLHPQEEEIWNLRKWALSPCFCWHSHAKLFNTIKSCKTQMWPWQDQLLERYERWSWRLRALIGRSLD